MGRIEAKNGVKTNRPSADIERVRQHCAQCLTEVLANGHQTPRGETLCAGCYTALWGPRENGDRLASDGRHPRRRRQRDHRSHWLGPTFEHKRA
jgi:hypothetical protein